MSGDDVCAVLRGALERLEQREWIQHDFVRYATDRDEEPTGYCLAGAIADAGRSLGEGRASRIARAKAHALIVKMIGGDSVTWWNDEPGRTKAEALDLLRRAIAAAEVER